MSSPEFPSKLAGQDLLHANASLQGPHLGNAEFQEELGGLGMEQRFTLT